MNAGQIHRQLVNSSAIRSAGYDAHNHVLEVEFTSGGVYRYHNVPEAEFRSMMSAPSVGGFFHQRIKKGPYRFEQYR